MRSLRVSLAAAALLLLSTSRLSAQAGKAGCKDGSPLKPGHFSCWGHGGIVTGATKPAAKSAKSAKTPARKSHATTAKASKKTHTKHAAKHGPK